MPDLNGAYKKFHEKLKRIRVKTLGILRASAQTSDEDEIEKVRRRLEKS